MKWIGIKNHLGRNDTWVSPEWPGIFIKHCGHPTALRPYYIQCNLIENSATPPKFKRVGKLLNI
jgi:hypothetical protein